MSDTKNNTKRKGRILPALLILIILNLALAAGLFFTNNPAPSDSQGGVFEVVSGDSLNSVALRLENRNFIRGNRFFKLLGRVLDLQTSLKVGRYEIPAGSSSYEIMKILVEGVQIEVRVTVPEGYSMKQIAALMEDRGVCGYDDFIAAAGDRANLGEWAAVTDSAQGLLFPETYQFPESYPADKVVRTMIRGLGEYLKEIDPEGADRGVDDLYSKVVLASIVEKEYRVDDEAPLIAGVFYNRLDLEMPLQSCATVVFIKTEILDQVHPEFLLYRDLEVESEYNTYINPGLPPGPIGSPGRVALNAALNPEPSDYLFFLVKDADAGRHVFSRTYAEHLSAEKIYLPRR